MKQTKWLLSALCAVVLVLSVTGVTGCKKAETDVSAGQAKKYTCTMHPEVVKDAPGNCPKCGMALVEKH